MLAIGRWWASDAQNPFASSDNLNASSQIWNDVHTGALSDIESLEASLTTLNGV